MSDSQEYLTGNRRTRYPFADDSVLSADDMFSAVVFGCFVDAYVQKKANAALVAPKVSNIAVSGKTISFDLSGEGVSAVSLSCSASGERFVTIHGESDWCWYSFVMSSDGISEFAELAESDASSDISSDELSLSERCVCSAPIGVSSLRIFGGGKNDPATGRRYTRSEAVLLEPDAVVKGDVVIEAGNNISFSGRQVYTAVSGAANSNEITINAIPGAGAGRVPCECDDAAAFKTPGLIGIDGHARLFNDTCYDLSPTRYSPESSELKIHAKCKACCTCEMYASIVNDKLVPLKDEIIRIKRDLESTKATYDINVEKWNDRILNAKPEDIVISMTGVPLEAAATRLSGSKVHGKMSRCSFSVTVRNDSFVKVRIELTDLFSNGEMFEKQVSYVDENLEPKIVKMPGTDATITLPPGRSATMTCFVRLGNMVTTDAQTGFMAYVTVTAKQGDRTIVTRRKGIVI